MTYPWAAGEVLNAADLNTYAGLVLVKTQTIGTAVSSVTVTGAFSSTFDNYRIIVQGGTGSGIVVLQCQLGSTTTGYYLSGVAVPYTGASSLQQTNNGAQWSPVGVQSTTYKIAQFELYNPYLADLTWIQSHYMYTANMISLGGYLNNTTSYTAFTLFPSSGTMTGGTIRVYGYNNG